MNSHIRTIAAASLLILASIIAAWMLRQADNARLQAIFQARVQNPFSGIKERLTYQEVSVQKLADVLELTPNLSSKQFRRLARRNESLGVQALEWIPLVKKNERTKLEQAAQARGFEDFEFRQWQADGTWATNSDHWSDEYAPVYYLYPFGPNESAFGIDLASNPTRKAALDEARETKRAVATARITLAQETEHQAGVLLFVPVYNSDADDAANEQLDDHLLGFALGVFRIGSTIDSLLTSRDIEGVHLRISDCTGDAPDVLYETDDWQTNPDSSWRKEETLEFGGRQWEFAWSFAPGYVASQRSWAPFSVLLFGLVASSGLGLLLRNLQETAKAAEESEQRFRALADSASPLAWTTERDSTCSWLNKRWLEYTGATLESQLGFGWANSIHPNDRERVQSTYLSAFEKRAPFEIEYRMRRHDGVFRWFIVDATPRFDEGGSFCGYVGMSFDTHDARLARDALEKSEANLQDAHAELVAKEQRLNLAITGTTDGLWDWDIETDAVWYAPRFLEMLGYDSFGDDRFPPVLDSFGNSVHPDDREHTWTAIEEHLQNKQPYDVRYRLRKADGSYIWCRARGKAIRNEDGKPFRMSGSVQIISDLIDAENRLLETNRDLERTNDDLEQFAYVASHDLRTPLRGIAHVASILREEESRNMADSSLQYLGKLDNRVQRMESLLDDMLAYSRAGKTTEQIESTDVNGVILDVIEMISPRDGLRVSIQEGMPTLRTVPSPLRQAFQNLIGNAVKYHDKEAGTIEVSVKEESEFFRFTISDDGPGIAPEYHKQVFEMFRRLHSKDSIEGTGLGLALVAKIVRQFGGDIWLDSDVGHGAAFHFTWPKQIKRSSHDSN